MVAVVQYSTVTQPPFVFVFARCSLGPSDIDLLSFPTVSSIIRIKIRTRIEYYCGVWCPVHHRLTHPHHWAVDDKSLPLHWEALETFSDTLFTRRWRRQ